MADGPEIPMQTTPRGVLRFPAITKEEVDRLAQEWCKSKHVIVMLDPVARDFALDVANKCIRDVMLSIMERAAKKKAQTQPGAATPQPLTGAAAQQPEKRKSSIVLTDGD